MYFDLPRWIIQTQTLLNKHDFNAVVICWGEQFSKFNCNFCKIWTSQVAYWKQKQQEILSNRELKDNNTSYPDVRFYDSMLYGHFMTDQIDLVCSFGKLSKLIRLSLIAYSIQEFARFKYSL